MSRYDGAAQEQANAKHNLLRRLGALEAAVSEQIRVIEAGYRPCLKEINHRWLAVDEATEIHRACAHAVDNAHRRVAS